MKLKQKQKQKLEKFANELYEKYDYSYNDIEDRFCIARIFIYSTNVEDMERENLNKKRSLHSVIFADTVLKNMCIDMVRNSNLEKYEVEDIVCEVYEDIIAERKSNQ